MKPKNKSKKASEPTESKKAKKSADPKREKTSTRVKQNGVPLNIAKEAADIEDEKLSVPDEEDDVGDQSAALLQGFESSSEEEDAEDEEAIAEVPSIPTDEKLKKKLKSAAETSNDEPGVIYVG